MKIKKYLEAQKRLARNYFQWWTKGLYTFCYQMQDVKCLQPFGATSWRFISENTSTEILKMAELLENFKALKSRY